MDNNPYRADYHKYLEDLKKSLDTTNSYAQSQPIQHPDLNLNYPVNIGPRKKVFVKYGLMSLAFIIIGISVISFLTQGALLVFDKKTNDNGPFPELNDQEKVNQELKNIYVRADLDRNIFATSTATATTSDEDITKYFNVNIPGVSRIGYDERLGNGFLTDNINKYSDGTLVLGERGNTSQNVGSNDVFWGDQYDIVEKAIIPVLSSRAYLMADLETGEIILDKNADTIYPIASVSKLMTGVVATEKMNLNDIAIVSRDASNTYGGQGSLRLGEKIILSDLIYPLLMESSNDAAEVFADHYGRQNFLDEMNKKARSLDMYDTYYGDPSGLDPKNTSTPNDLLKLVRYIWKNDPSIFATTRVKQFSIKGHTWYNRNAQLPLAGFIGGKNGYIDQALQTTASIFEIPTAKGGNRKVVIVILKSNDKNGDVNKLIKFLKNSVVYTP